MDFILTNETMKGIPYKGCPLFASEINDSVLDTSLVVQTDSRAIYELAPSTLGAIMCSIKSPSAVVDESPLPTVPTSVLGAADYCALLSKLKRTSASAAGESDRPTRESLFGTFWTYVDRRGDDECWPWFAYRHAKGYGRSFVRIDGEIYVVPHRASWAIHYGPPGHLHVLHKCDNPPCVNPRHLFLGTNADNVRDRVAKGRTQRGHKHFKSHLTDDDVRAIRASTESKAELGRKYDVTTATIRAILLRITWKHIE